MANCTPRVQFGSLLLVACVQMGCSLLETKQESDLIDTAANISGKVEVTSSQQGQAYVQLFRQGNGNIEMINKLPLARSGRYSLTVLPDTYFIGSFVDANNDRVYQDGEPATYHGIEGDAPIPIELSEDDRYNAETLTVSGPIKTKPQVDIVSRLTLANQNIGRLIAFDHEMFSRDNASKGFWRPLEHLDEYGGGLMILQEYQVDKTPIIFVHGILGTATEFSDLIDRLDLDRFQPWILQYPSGIRLDMVSDYFVQAMDLLQAKFQFERAIIVAHSMGGLMTRSFVMKHQESNANYELSMVMTINSPLYGMDSAASGVNRSPIVIPVWRDVASSSEYVNRVHSWTWPEEIPYHLVFSYLPNEGSDGVVPLESQLSLSLQDEAVRILGFEAQHAQILHDKAFIERFNRILEGY